MRRAPGHAKVTSGRHNQQNRIMIYEVDLWPGYGYGLYAQRVTADSDEQALEIACTNIIKKQVQVILSHDRGSGRTCRKLWANRR